MLSGRQRHQHPAAPMYARCWLSLSRPPTAAPASVPPEPLGNVAPPLRLPQIVNLGTDECPPRCRDVVGKRFSFGWGERTKQRHQRGQFHKPCPSREKAELCHRLVTCTSTSLSPRWATRLMASATWRAPSVTELRSDISNPHWKHWGASNLMACSIASDGYCPRSSS